LTQGWLTAKNLIKLRFPDMVKARATGLYEQLLNGSNSMRYDLQVSEDGTKATLTTSYFCQATVGAGAKPLDTFAPFTVQTRLTFDLSAEVPTVIDARFAQTID
jgi:hypothetical protein